MEKLKNNVKYLGAIGCIIIMIGTFLPYISASASYFGATVSETTNYFSGQDGKLIFFAALLCAIIFFLFDIIKNNKVKYSIISSVLSFMTVIVIYGISNTDDKVEELKGMYAGIKINHNFEIGLYVVIIGLVISAGSFLFYYLKNKGVINTTINFNNQGVSNNYNPGTFANTNTQNNYNQPVINNSNNLYNNIPEKYCVYCNTKIDENAKFCPSCGNNIQ